MGSRKQELKSHLNRRVLVVAIVLSTTALVSSKSSRLVMSWRNPNYTPEKKFHRVLALGLSDKTEVRVDFDDVLAAQLASSGFEAVPGNTILLRPKATRLDLNDLNDQIRANQIEAVVVSRLIKVEDTVTYIPGAPYSCPFLTTILSTVTTARFTRWSTRPATSRKKRRSALKPTSM